MPFYGDPYPLERWYGDLGVVIPMSTALLKHYLSPGFVLGADGLKQKIEDDGTTTTEIDSCQKIFPIRQRGRALAYSLTGTVQLDGETSQRAGFDFAARTRDAIKSMAKSKATDLKAYVTDVCASLSGLLYDAKTSGEIARYPAQGGTDHTIIEILFDGYYEGKPVSVSARFFHDNQVLASPEILNELNDEGGMRIIGSTQIATRLFKTDDPLFDIYRQSWIGDSPLVLAVQKAKSYFLACSNPEVRKLDPRACATIGGRTHMATITREQGFQWVEGFKPKGIK